MPFQAFVAWEVAATLLTMLTWHKTRVRHAPLGSANNYLLISCNRVTVREQMTMCACSASTRVCVVQLQLFNLLSRTPRSTAKGTNHGLQHRPLANHSPVLADQRRHSQHLLQGAITRVQGLEHHGVHEHKP